MTIGPFSLMTKLLADPILPVGMAGAGATAEDDPEVALVEKLLELSLLTILRSVEAQIAAGAKVIVVAEPAANKVFISPNQLADGSDVFERYVMIPNRRIKALLQQNGVDLFFHCCGELVECMVRDFASLDPAVMSLGCSRNLWEDAALVPKTTVLFGNLPTKNFYSDDVVPQSKVVELSRDITIRMRQAGHPFILGSECDVLSVPGREQTIRDKVNTFMTCEI
jgi:uroporphyrinogen-III decarboxylase